MAGIDFKKINKNRGKFTEKANRAGMGVQAYAKHVLANTGNYDTKTVRQASFAKAATKFKHKHGLGGWMYGDGGAEIVPAVVVSSPDIYVTDKKRINAAARDVKKNSKADFIKRLKEKEIATIPDWENPGYVSSHKMSSTDNYVYPSILNIDGQLYDFTNPETMAAFGNPFLFDLAWDTGNVVGFPNDEMADRYATNYYKKFFPATKKSYKESKRKGDLKACGGKIWAYGGNPAETNGGYFSNGLTFIDEGGSHEENPYEGVMMGQDNLGIPNLVEEGEVKYKIDGDDYIFSNRLKIDKSLCKAAGLPMSFAGKTYAQAFKSIQKESSERPLDGISKRGLDAYASRLKALQEEQRRLMGLQGTQNLQFDNTQLQQPQGYGQQMPYGNQPAQEPVEDTGAYVDNDYYGGYGAYDDTANMSAYGGNIYSRGGKAAKRMGYTGKEKRQVKKWLDDNYPDLDLRSLTDDDLALYNNLYRNASVQDMADRLVESAPGTYLQLDPAVVLDYANKYQIMEDNMSRKEKRNARRNTKNQYLQFRSNLVDFLDKNPNATYQDFIDLMNIIDTNDPNYYYTTPPKSGNEVSNDINRSLGLSLLAMTGLGSAATRRAATKVAKEAVKPLAKSIGKKAAKSLAKSMGRAGAAMLGAEGASGLYGILGGLNPLAVTAAAALTTPELYEMAPGTDSDVKMYNYRPQMYRNKQLRQDFNSLPGVARMALQDQYDQRFSNGNWILNAPNEFARRTGINNWVPWLINAPETIKGLTQPTVDLLPYYNQNDVDRYYKPFSDADVDYNNNELAFGGMARKYEGTEDFETPAVSSVSPLVDGSPDGGTQTNIDKVDNSWNSDWIQGDEYSLIRHLHELNKDSPDMQNLNKYQNYQGYPENTDFRTLYRNDSPLVRMLTWMDQHPDDELTKNLINRMNAGEYGDLNGNVITLGNLFGLSSDFAPSVAHHGAEKYSTEIENAPWLDEIEHSIVDGYKPQETPEETNKENPASDASDALNKLKLLNQQGRFLQNQIKNWDLPEGTVDQANGENANNNRKYYQTWSRYAPAFMAGLSLFNPAAYKSDYSNADIIGKTPLKNHYNNYQFAPEYQKFDHVDQNMLVNQQRAQTGATQRQIRGMTGSAPNAMAGLIAAGYNGQNQLGTNMIQARQYNNQGRMAAVNANNQVNLSNAQLGLQSSVYNANRSEKTDEARLSRNATYAKMREDIDSSNAEQFAKTLSTLGTTLGQIGHDNFLLNNNIDGYYKKQNGANSFGAVSACGGRLRKRRKTGLKGF